MKWAKPSLICLLASALLLISAKADQFAWITTVNNDCNLHVYNLDIDSEMSFTLPPNAYLTRNYSNAFGGIAYCVRQNNQTKLYMVECGNGMITDVLSIRAHGIVYALYDDCCIIVDDDNHILENAMEYDGSPIVLFNYCYLAKYSFDGEIVRYPFELNYCSEVSKFCIDRDMNLVYINDDGYLESYNLTHNCYHDSMFVDYVNDYLRTNDIIAREPIMCDREKFIFGLYKLNDVFLRTNESEIMAALENTYNEYCTLYDSFDFSEERDETYDYIKKLLTSEHRAKLSGVLNLTLLFECDQDGESSASIVKAFDYSYEFSGNVAYNRSHNGVIAYAIRPYNGVYADQDCDLMDAKKTIVIKNLFDNYSKSDNHSFRHWDFQACDFISCECIVTT